MLQCQRYAASMLDARVGKVGVELTFGRKRELAQTDRARGVEALETFDGDEHSDEHAEQRRRLEPDESGSANGLAKTVAHWQVSRALCQARRTIANSADEAFLHARLIVLRKAREQSPDGKRGLSRHRGTEQPSSRACVQVQHRGRDGPSGDVSGFEAEKHAHPRREHAVDVEEDPSQVDEGVRDDVPDGAAVRLREPPLQRVSRVLLIAARTAQYASSPALTMPSRLEKR